MTKSRKQRRFERRLAARRELAWLALVGKIAQEGPRDKECNTKKE